MTLKLRSLPLASLLALAALATLAPSARGEDKPKTEASPGGAALLRQLLDAPSEAKKKPLREQLVKQGARAVREAIKGLVFPEADETGVITLDVKCPDGHERPNFLRVPGSYDAKKSYPMLVLLHGAVGGAPAEFAEELLEYWTRFLGDKWKNEVLLLAPAAVTALTDRTAAWFHDVGMRNVAHVIATVKARYNVDDDRVFVSGMSDGGSGSFALATAQPDSFAGYFPMVGHPMVMTQAGTHFFGGNLKGQNVYAIQGARDPLMPAADLEALYKQLNEDGIGVKYTMDKQAAHDLSFAAIEFPEILDKMVGVWKRRLHPSDLREIDWSCDTAGNGRRAWVAIDSLADLGQANANIAPKLYYAVRLGITLPQPVDPNGPVTVETVQKGMPADAMGLKPGDKLVKFDDVEVASFNKLRELLAKKRYGDKVTLVVSRGDEQLTLKGEFTPPVVNEEKPLAARVLAKLSERGRIEVQAYNVGRLSLWVGPNTVGKDGGLKVFVNGKEVLSTKPEESAALLLAEFERTLDRKRDFFARVEIDLVKALDVQPKKPVKPPVEEDF